MSTNLLLHEDRPQPSTGVNGLSRINQSQQIALLERLGNRKHNRNRPINLAPVLDDIVVQCPKCHTLETLQFAGVIMTPSSKFFQKNGLVYHDCGSTSPCRLFGRIRLPGRHTNTRLSSPV
jgi:hypothetical protein